MFTAASEFLEQNQSHYQSDNVEVEVRFGSYNYDGSFNASINHKQYVRLLQLLLTTTNSYTETHTVDTFYPSISGRFTDRYDADGNVVESYHLEKQNVTKFDNREYNFRVAISNEIKQNLERPVEESTLVREKKRKSFDLFRNSRYRLDLTEVTVIKDSEATVGSTSYEVEIEFTDFTQQSIDNMSQVLLLVLREVQNTRIVYTTREKTLVVGEVAEILNNQTGMTTLRNSSLTQARNLKIRDMVGGGLIPDNSNGISYRATVKADGLRKLLYIGASGVYFVMPRNQLMKILDSDVAQLLEEWQGSVFEGEFILRSNMSETASDEEKSSLVFYIFDTLALLGSKLIQSQIHSFRLKYGEAIGDLLSNIPGIRIKAKKFYSFNTASQMFNASRTILATDHPFKTDGIIFTPENFKYDTSTRDLELYERRLTRYQDVVKWKPPSQITIDFEIQYVIDNDQTVVKPFVSVQGGSAEFTGTNRFPFTGTLDLNGLNVPGSTVLEFAYNYNTNEFVAERIRYDKDQGNFIDIAKDNWEDIMQPIPEKLIRGEEFGLVFRYHNTLKKQLFSIAKNRGCKTLLDIGSGKGGDIYKWNSAGFTKVVCVEPSAENREELERRLSQSAEFSYVILPYKGDEYKKIIAEATEFLGTPEVDCLSYMLSLSFLTDQKNIRSIDRLSKFVKSKGLFLSFNIDGDKVQKYFGNVTNAGSDWVDSTFTQITFRYNPSKKEIFINIPDSIVTDQTEGLFNTSSFINKVLSKTYNKTAVLDTYATGEPFLNEEEKIFTGFYRSFVLEKL